MATEWDMLSESSSSCGEIGNQLPGSEISECYAKGYRSATEEYRGCSKVRRVGMERSVSRVMMPAEP